MTGPVRADSEQARQAGAPTAGPGPAAPPERADRRRMHRALLVAAAGLVAVLVLGLAVRSRVPAPDAWLHAFAVRHRGGWVRPFARVVTEGGSTRTVWPLVVLASLAFPHGRGPRRWLESLGVGGVAAGLIGVRLLLSDALLRARPPRADWAMTAGGYAFPSGHTTAATLGAGLLAWALARHLRAAPARVAVWAAAVGYAGLVGWSRIWLGVHWPLDVLGGWLLATGWLAGMAAAVLAVRRALPGLFDTDRRAAATTTTPTTTATDPTGRG